MAKRVVVFEIGSSTSVQVDCDSIEDAVNKAYEEVYTPSLCYHCSKEIDIGDIGDVVSILNIETDEDETNLYKQLTSASTITL